MHSYTANTNKEVGLQALMDVYNRPVYNRLVLILQLVFVFSSKYVCVIVWLLCFYLQEWT